MADKLIYDLQDIKEDRNTNLLPENLKFGVTCLGITGTLVKLEGEERTITPSISEQVITPSEGKNGITSATVNPVTSTIDSNIQAENIKKDISILGVTGTLETGVDTSDATAAESDIVSGKTAYVDGNKITGTVAEYSNNSSIGVGKVTNNSSINCINVYNSNADDTPAFDKLLRGGAALRAPYAKVAEAIGLTADKIKAGETILGITGTYTGETTE